MNLTLRVWRQKNRTEKGRFEIYKLDDVSPDMSFLEMLDMLNNQLIAKGEEPVAFDSDCREGICGTCGVMVDGVPHGPVPGTTCCQLHMRVFQSGNEITIEPWRAKAFPVLRDLIVDRGAFDRVIQAGGYVSVNTGQAPDAHAVPVPKPDADAAFDAAACIGCGACVAGCKNGSAMLFTSAKVTQLARLPQGSPERKIRVLEMVRQMDVEGFGNCTNTYECEAVCPKLISVKSIAQLNRDYIRAMLSGE